MSIKDYYSEGLKASLEDIGLSSEQLQAVIEDVINLRENESEAIPLPSVSDQAYQKVRDLTEELSMVTEQLGRFYQETCPICDGRGDVPADVNPTWYVPCKACRGKGKVWRNNYV